MNILQVIILSVIEGLTEFLPVSSTGHMILASFLMKIAESEFVKSFEIIIQLGAILSVLFLYRKNLFRNLTLWIVVICAFLPTAFLGFIFYGMIKNILMENVFIIIAMLFLGGIILILSDFLYKEEKAKTNNLESITIKQAVFIGLSQSISMIPGVSRSAATILGGLSLGLDKKTAIEFSFILAIPTMMAATSLDLYKNGLSFNKNEVIFLLIGFSTAFIFALLAVQYFLQIIKKKSFVFFGVYRIVLAIIFYLIIL